MSAFLARKTLMKNGNCTYGTTCFPNPAGKESCTNTESVKAAFFMFTSIATEPYRKLTKYKQEHIFL